jgi:hypothetical protein
VLHCALVITILVTLPNVLATSHAMTCLLLELTLRPRRDNPTIMDYSKLKVQVVELEKQVGASCRLFLLYHHTWFGKAVKAK